MVVILIIASDSDQNSGSWDIDRHIQYATTQDRLCYVPNFINQNNYFRDRVQ